MIERDATFGHNLFQVSKAKIVGQIPSHTKQDYRSIKMAALEHRNFPGSTLNLFNRTDIIDGKFATEPLAEDDIDIVLNVGMPGAQSVIAKKLVAGRRVVLASPEYIRSFGAPLKPDDLLSHECVLLMRGRRVFNRWLFRQGSDVHEIHVSGRLMSTSSEVVYDWILQGRGIGIKGSWDVEHDLSTGRLVECLPAYAFDLADLFLVYASKRHLPLRVRAFIDFLTERFANRPATG